MELGNAYAIVRKNELAVFVPIFRINSDNLSGQYPAGVRPCHYIVAKLDLFNGLLCPIGHQHQRSVDKARLYRVKVARTGRIAAGICRVGRVGGRGDIKECCRAPI